MSATVLRPSQRVGAPPDFAATLQVHALRVVPQAVDTLQVNITRRCNQVCRHCHVDASPARDEMMSPTTMQACLDVLARHDAMRALDVTGGAPELHPQFEWFVARAHALGKRVMVRHNLTVQLDGDPRSGVSKSHLPEFFARHGVGVICSLPYHQAGLTDAQRGAGVFAKSLEALRRLNAVGYGREGSGLLLHLVYNPVGPYLPPPQAALEADYRRELGRRYGIVFNRLYTITNMPVNRFRQHLEKSGQYARYLEKLATAFNPAAAAAVMCRTLISVGWDGAVYDCDFNQMAGLVARDREGRVLRVEDFDLSRVLGREIRFDAHCFGCAAGAGSSCGGATT